MRGAHPTLLPPSQQLSTASSGGGACVAAANYLNTQFTVEVALGHGSSDSGYRAKLVPDSGSFEIVLPGSSCSACTCTQGKSLYNTPSNASDAPRVSLQYGQGGVRNAYALFDQVTLGTVSASHQSFLLMQEQTISGYCESFYDGVLGLGRRANARDDSDDLSFLQNANMHNFSICFGKNDGDAGRLQLGAPLPSLQYDYVPVLGSKHWAVQLLGVGFFGAGMGGDGGDGEYTACTSGRLLDRHCAAIIDSGTSLISGPEAGLAELLKPLDNVPVHENCSNIDSLPTLRFQVGHGDEVLELEMTPDMYVTRTTADDLAFSASIDHHLRHGSGRSSGSGSSSSSGGGSSSGGSSSGSGGDGSGGSHNFSTARGHGKARPTATGGAAPLKCVLMFMKVEMTDHSYGPVWILGMPFLRAFAVHFDRGNATTSSTAEALRREKRAARLADGGVGDASTDANRTAVPAMAAANGTATRHSPRHATATAAADRAEQIALFWRPRDDDDSGMSIGFARVPDDANPCNGCAATADGSKLGGYATTLDEVEPPVVSLRHTRLPAWAAASGLSRSVL